MIWVCLYFVSSCLGFEILLNLEFIVFKLLSVLIDVRFRICFGGGNFIKIDFLFKKLLVLKFVWLLYKWLFDEDFLKEIDENILLGWLLLFKLFFVVMVDIFWSGRLVCLGVLLFLFLVVVFLYFLFNNFINFFGLIVDEYNLLWNILVFVKNMFDLYINILMGFSENSFFMLCIFLKLELYFINFKVEVCWFWNIMVRREIVNLILSLKLMLMKIIEVIVYN